MSQKPEQGKINVVNVWEDSFKLEFGKSTKKSGELSFRSLEAVTKSLKENNVDIVTIGQYLQPSKKHLPVKDFITPHQFKIYESLSLIHI